MKIGQALIRRIKFHIRRPTPPKHPFRFTGPVVVVGSAPISSVPSGFDNSFRVISVNGSQTVSKKWGREKPDVTFMTTKQIRGTNTNAVSVRSVVKGQATTLLYITLWDGTPGELKTAIEPLEYRYEDLRILSRMQRMALHHQVLGKVNLELRAEERFSNGITGVLYALTNGAPAVIISGVNPGSSGHIYNDANLRRQHSQTDLDILRTLVADGWPVFTADEEVSKATGIPIWKALKKKRNI
jgi:hypothetical protein